MTTNYIPPIVIAGQFPPPLTGFAFITQEMARLITRSGKTVLIDLSPHQKRGVFLYHIKRMRLAAKGVFTLFNETSGEKQIFYIACDGGLGLIYTAVLCAVARFLDYKIYLHHHSFAYIERSQFLMSALLHVAGRKLTHIFLSQNMAAQFNSRYEKRVNFEVISNSAFIQPCAGGFPARPEPRQNLIIGMLSNLSIEKGLDVFLELAQKADKQGLNITAVLAGSPETEIERRLIETAQKELGKKLDYRGAIYGDDKDSFYRSIDVFIFPTRYANEAQPTVVYEAMARGVPVLAYDRGSIRSQIGQSGAVLDRDADFIPFALSHLREWLSEPDILLKLKHDCVTAFTQDCEQSQSSALTLFPDLSA